MPTLSVRQFENTFTIHFGTDLPRISAYTLASTLIGIADAARAANATINPGYRIEVVVEALGEGSFKATLKTIYSEAGDLFSKNALKTVVLAVIANYIYQHTLAPDTSVKVTVESDEVVISQGETRIVVPRDVYEVTKEVENSPGFRKGVSDAVRAIDADPHVHEVGITSDAPDEPPVRIPRDRFAVLVRELSGPVSDERELVETTDLQIIRAILERSRRRWQFVWNGIRISAPVLDETFYSDFFDHKILIAPGDILRVRLRVKQRRDPDLGVFINDTYEVVDVLEHIPRSRQRRMPDG